jgi:Flp pilus assembly protein TadD
MVTKRRGTLELKLTPKLKSYLPEHVQHLSGTEFNQAVAVTMRELMNSLDGLVTSISVEGDMVKVEWERSRNDREPIESILPFLRTGRYAEALLLLELLLTDEPNDVNYLYNLGMVYSDRGELERSIQLLRRLLRLAPDHTNGHIALGVALTRNGEMNDAVRQFEIAISHEPNNALAHRNLGATLGKLGRKEDAVRELRLATELNPDDQAAWYGLGQALEQLGNTDAADEAYVKALEIDEFGNIAELSRKARSQIAGKNFRAVTPNMERMDAVMYCLGALEKFERMNLSEVQKVGFEIAMLGTRGININDPTPHYTLRSLPGQFSGLHLLCLEYVAFKKFAPEQDIGFDLSAEYCSALSLHQGKQK